MSDDERTSPRLAILRFCVGCIVDPGDPAPPAEQIAGCPSRRCPLWPHRPTAPELAAEAARGGVQIGVARRKRASLNTN